MIVAGGKILALGRVEHDTTLSGDGREKPIGLAPELLAEIRKIDEKLDKSAFESWSAQTEYWDISAYNGRDGIGVKDHEIYVSADYMFTSGMSAYAQSAWVDETFLKKTDRPEVPEYFGGYGIRRIEEGDDFRFSFSGASSSYPVIGDGTESSPFGLAEDFTQKVNTLYDDVGELKTTVAWLSDAIDSESANRYSADMELSGRIDEIGKNYETKADAKAKVKNFGIMLKELREGSHTLQFYRPTDQDL